MRNYEDFHLTEAMADVERAIAAQLMNFKGISLAVSSHDLLTGNVPATWQAAAVLHNHDPDRSGDIYVAFAPHTFINDFDRLTVSATHGSPWRYGAHVPVIFAGHGMATGQVLRGVTPYDIAPTLAAYLGLTQPSGAIGTPLAEVLRQQDGARWLEPSRALPVSRGAPSASSLPPAHRIPE